MKYSKDNVSTILVSEGEFNDFHFTLNHKGYNTFLGTAYYDMKEDLIKYDPRWFTNEQTIRNMFDNINSLASDFNLSFLDSLYKKQSREIDSVVCKLNDNGEIFNLLMIIKLESSGFIFVIKANSFLLGDNKNDTFNINELNINKLVERSNIMPLIDYKDFFKEKFSNNQENNQMEN